MGRDWQEALIVSLSYMAWLFLTFGIVRLFMALLRLLV